MYSMDSPVGRLRLEAADGKLVALHFDEAVDEKMRHSEEEAVIKNVHMQLDEYFAGERQQFDLPLAPAGTDFEREVWNALAEIPFGQTITYLQLAKKLGDSNKVRAVGRANGQNPVAIIIPCHRVIGANNKLTGYAGGIERKRWLLQHEGALLL